MSDLPNAFEHQRFRVRTPRGERLSRSFRDLVTATDGDGTALDADEALALDYPQEYVNVAALGLLAFLAQVAFEPETPAALAERLRTPISADEYEAKVSGLRAHFRLDGDGPRFMQGRPPTVAEVKSWTTGLDAVVPTVRTGEAQFLNRPDVSWGVAPDQAGLLLFARNTFYEGTAGRGYQKGVNGDTPVRTMPTDPAEGDAVRLRRSLWLNVLTTEAQRSIPGRYAAPGDAGAYDGWFWESPPTGDVGLGQITLRAALGWMSANHWLLYEDDQSEHVCAVTGEPITGRVAAQAVKWSTGIPYGTKSTKDDSGGGQNASRLFHHPNVPLERVRDPKTGDYAGSRAYNVRRTRGLVDAIGASFFGAGGTAGHVEPAPVVQQLGALALRREVRAPRLAVFGFHMLSGQKNVHGGFEIDTFRFTPPDDSGRAEHAAALLETATRYADRAAFALGKSVQIAAGVGVRATEDEDGRTALDRFEARKTTDGRGFSGDTVARFWRAVQSGETATRAPVPRGLHGLVEAITDYDGPLNTQDAKAATIGPWETSVQAWARAAFDDAAAPYRTAPRTMPLVPVAARMLNAALRKNATFADPPSASVPAEAPGSSLPSDGQTTLAL